MIIWPENTGNPAQKKEGDRLASSAHRGRTRPIIVLPFDLTISPIAHHFIIYSLHYEVYEEIFV